MNYYMLFRQGYDLDNHYQRVEAAGMVFHIANAGFDGSLAQTIMMGERPHNWIPELDGRTAEMKAMRKAERELYEALSIYDRCRRECIAKAKEKKK